jgi:two-component system cell cycle response regulator
MPLQRSDKSTGCQGSRERLSLTNHRSNARVLSIDWGKGTLRETLESVLASALRSDDTEFDQILSALEEISNGLESGAFSAPSLESALQGAALCAMKQSLLDREIRSLALTDELTGFCNRRGFLASATHHLKLAHRNAQDVLLLFCDLDNLKKVNDSFGHRAGDLALIGAADALERTFRDSDILARLGGDEFAILASGASTPNRQAIESRMENSLAKVNAGESRYDLSFSIGVAQFDPETPTSLGELMARANQDMHVSKKYHPRPASLRHS